MTMSWLGVRDEDLPTWLHTTLLLVVVSPFSLTLLYWGLKTLACGHFDPVSGPEVGQWWFGRDPLDGRPATLAGAGLILNGLAFLAIALPFMRWNDDHPVLRAAMRVLPWVLLAVAVVYSFWANGQLRG
jgi:hypothetical protein